MISREDLAKYLHDHSDSIIDWSELNKIHPSIYKHFLTLAENVQSLIAQEITIAINVQDEENRLLRGHLESATKSEHRLRLDLEQALKDRDNHKRVRRAITKQLKDVEKARKQEFDMYLEKFSIAQQIIISLKEKITMLEAANTSFWKFW